MYFWAQKQIGFLPPAHWLFSIRNNCVWFILTLKIMNFRNDRWHALCMSTVQIPWQEHKNHHLQTEAGDILFDKLTALTDQYITANRGLVGLTTAVFPSSWASYVDSYEERYATGPHASISVTLVLHGAWRERGSQRESQKRKREGGAKERAKKRERGGEKEW